MCELRVALVPGARVMHGDTGEVGQYRGGVQGVASALAAAGDHGPQAGRGQVQPAKLGVGAEAGLVEMRYRCAGDPVGDRTDESVEVAGGAGGPRRHRAVRDRCAEQLVQCLRSALIQ